MAAWQAGAFVAGVTTTRSLDGGACPVSGVFDPVSGCFLFSAMPAVVLAPASAVGRAGGSAGTCPALREEEVSTDGEAQLLGSSI
jgi:hypothetical protein